MPMDTSFFKGALGWGVGLWLIGYLLGFVLYMFVPTSLIGWVIMPIGIFITLWVLRTKIKSASLRHYFFLAIIWTAIAVVFDYLFLVTVLKPADGYYKLDVYIYYALTFALPVMVGWYRTKARRADNPEIRT